MDFSEKAKNYCKQITCLALDIFDLSKSLKNQLMDDDIIDDTTSFYDIYNNKNFKSALLLSLVLGLPTEPCDYGLNIISKFDLYQASTDDLLQSKLSETTYTDQQFEELATRRNSLRIAMITTRSTVMHYFQLPETPSLKRKAVKNILTFYFIL